jgi:hypothetical protein
MDRARVQALVRQCASGLFDLACAVSGRSRWDLGLPVGVIDARRASPRLVVTAVGTISSVLRTSACIGHPLMRRFFERFEAVGLEQALLEFRSGPDADDFAEVWDAYIEERRASGQAMWSVEDATAFVLQTRDHFQDREVACAAILPGRPHEIVTFGVPISFLTRP